MKLNKSCSKKCGGNCCGTGSQDFSDVADREFTIALAGQPNTGKSTIFNMITGASQHVGNWPGKTVEKKEGQFDYGGRTCHIYDLPGTYSLTANSLEEIIARDFILKESPDVVVVVVDAAQLERSLYMVAETISLQVPVIIALNKMDVAGQRGLSINPDMLKKTTGLKTIAITASKREGMDELLEAITEVRHKKNPLTNRPKLKKAFGPLFGQLFTETKQYCPPEYPPEWVNIKLLEGDGEIRELMQNRVSTDRWQHIEKLLSTCEKGIIISATARYNWINDIVSSTIVNRDTGRVSHNTFDTVATHPVWGKGVAMVVLLLGIVAAYIAAIPLMAPGFLLFFSANLVRDKIMLFAPPWFASLLADGIIRGLSAGCVILGFIGGVFLILGILENTGYLARLAYIFDPFMKRIGLHGKSVLPLMMGFVCNILGVAGTRVIDSWRQRIVTLVIAPIVPCKSLLIVVTFISAIFFGSKTLPIIAVLFLIMFLYIFVTSFLLQKFIVTGEQTGLLMELPPYHKPNWKNVWMYTMTRVKSFFHSGFWFIAIFSFFIWVTIYFPDGSINTSYLASFGKLLEPFGQVMGWDWRLCISFLIAFASKEATLGAMAIIFGAATSESTDLIGFVMDKELWTVVQGDFGSFLAATGVSAASALAFVFAIFFSLPCFATLGMIYAETRSLKWTCGTLLYYFAMSITMGILAYQAGLLLF
jgi:ferrous iron transport protein B